MIEYIKEKLKPYYVILYQKFYLPILYKKNIKLWIGNGKKGSPPHPIKQEIIRKYKIKFAINTLIETGTYTGEMIRSQLKNFSKIYSIEISQSLFALNQTIFKRYGQVKLFCGDSTEILPKILNDNNEKCLFWLDAHYSGTGTGRGLSDCPILQELNIILNDSIKEHVILIDDARLFIGKNSYPSIDELKTFVNERNQQLNIEVDSDIIRISPIKSSK